MKNKARVSQISRLGGALVIAGSLVSCGLPENQGIKIGVPYRAQEQFNYCAATCVQMWALYDGVSPTPSQGSIFNYMLNYSSGCGSNLLGVSDAVGQFTYTPDAYVDLEVNLDGTAYEDLSARAITSIESDSPAIVVVNGDHTVVLNGGKWHGEDTRDIWDFVYIHDPAFDLANWRREASDWLEMFCPGYETYCSQVVSSSATLGWSFNLVSYGPWVEIRGICDESNFEIQC